MRTFRSCFIRGALAVAACAASLPAQAAEEPVIDVEAGAPPVAHVPFGLGDLLNPETGRPLMPREAVTVRVEGKVFFQGLSDDLLRLVNDLERDLNRMGQTLRVDGRLNFGHLADLEGANRQFLSNLGLRASVVAGKLKEALVECPLLRLEDLGVNAATERAFAPADAVSVEAGLQLEARQFVARVNNQQKILCTLGYSLWENLAERTPEGLASVGDAIAAIKDARDRLLSFLGISPFHAQFDWAVIEEIMPYAQMAAEVAELVERRQVPSPEQLQQWRSEINARLPADLEIPDLPNIPAPDPPRRMDLKLKKRKDWRGLDQGSRGLFNVHANAYYEIRGSEVAQEASAEGKAGLFVFGSEINALYGFGQFYAGPDAVRGKLMLRALGQDIFAPVDVGGSLAYTWRDPRLFHWDFDRSYRQQFFIGPIPISVKVGARAGVFLGYEVALVTTELRAALLPGANAHGYVDGGVGFSGILSAGAGGELELLSLSPTLSGFAGLRFDDVGVPFLRLGLNSDLVYAALSGRVYAFAEYPVPRWGLPPWKIKKSTLDIFKFPGFRGNYKIMNWGMDLSPFGASMSGDLIDQTDRAETRHLEAVLDLESRKRALHDLELAVQNKERAVFATLMQDLASPASQGVPVEAALVVERQAQAQAARVEYGQALGRFVEM